MNSPPPPPASAVAIGVPVVAAEPPPNAVAVAATPVVEPPEHVVAPAPASNPPNVVVDIEAAQVTDTEPAPTFWQRHKRIIIAIIVLLAAAGASIGIALSVVTSSSSSSSSATDLFNQVQDLPNRPSSPSPSSSSSSYSSPLPKPTLPTTINNISTTTVGIPIDTCVTFSKDCGLPAADKWCKGSGYAKSIAYGIGAKVSKTILPTLNPDGTFEYCVSYPSSAKYCTPFEWITCSM